MHYIYSMSTVSRAEVISTVSGLSDDRLLEQIGTLARLDHQVQVFVIDHLCEIEARKLQDGDRHGVPARAGAAQGTALPHRSAHDAGAARRAVGSGRAGSPRPESAPARSARRGPAGRRRANFGAEAVSVADWDHQFSSADAARPASRGPFLDERVSAAGDHRLFGAEVAARQGPGCGFRGEADGSAGVHDDFDTEVPGTGPRNSGGGETADLAARPRTLPLCRSTHRTPLYFTASPPDRSRFPVRSGRRCGAQESEAPVRGSSPPPPPPPPRGTGSIA